MLFRVPRQSVRRRREGGMGMMILNQVGFGSVEPQEHELRAHETDTEDDAAGGGGRRGWNYYFICLALAGE